jgi:NAD(P)-dependent dehydrogenase (short-subunit alcohol dehydrogenase family)
VLLVTGATGAVGFEVAAEALSQGYRVAVHGRTAETCSEAVRRLRSRAPDGAVFPAPADFLAPGAIAAMVEAAVAEGGRLDAVVNCAVSAPSGITGLLRDTDPTQYAALAHHALATLQTLCHAAAPHSDAGRFAAARQSLIAASRAGIIGFCRSLGVEWAHDGMRINCVSLSFVEQTPVFERFLASAGSRAEASRKKAGLGLPAPADIAPLVLFLCGPGAAKITGQVVSINGGLNA